MTDKISRFQADSEFRQFLTLRGLTPAYEISRADAIKRLGPDEGDIFAKEQYDYEKITGFKARVTPKTFSREDFQSQSKSTIFEDFEWVYTNLRLEDPPDPNDAPSSGAWGLLEWARSRKDQFYSEWVKMATKQLERHNEQEVAADAAIAIDEMQQMLSNFNAALQPDSENLSRESSVPDSDSSRSGQQSADSTSFFESLI